MKIILAIFIGGFLGGMCRFLVGEMFFNIHPFPVETFVVNLVGCFFLGWFLAFVKNKQKLRPEIILFFGTGFTGSFTTFSTFSVETIALLQNNQIAFALFYVLGSILLGLLSSYSGYRLGIRDSFSRRQR